MDTIVILRSQMQSEGAGEYVKALMEEGKYFPVREDTQGEESWYYEDGYGTSRSYGGERIHEGIDIMTSNNQAGYFQIQSVSDGVVENIGWLELGGYRIGIRGGSGLYYYYAHMDSYRINLKKGDHVKAGQILGTMGNTGYGTEVTRGKFDVHLHFGIYFSENGQEMTMNPYNLLRYLEYGIIEKQ